MRTLQPDKLSPCNVPSPVHAFQLSAGHALTLLGDGLPCHFEVTPPHPFDTDPRLRQPKDTSPPPTTTSGGGGGGLWA